MQGKWYPGMIWTSNHGVDPVDNDTSDLPVTIRDVESVTSQIDAALITKIVGRTGLTSDTTLTDIIPAGWAIDKIYLTESASSDCQLSLGLTSSGGEIFNSEAVTAGGTVRIIATHPGNVSTATTLYLHDNGSGDMWNSATIQISIVIHRIMIL